MGIMCSAVTTTGIVTFDIDVGPDGRALYRVTWWNGRKWAKTYYRSFKAALKTYKMVQRMI